MYFALLFLHPLCWILLNVGSFCLIYLILANYNNKTDSAAEADALVQSMVAVGVVVALAAIAMPYLPSADKYATDAAAAELLSQSEQILAAIDKRSVSAKGDLTNLQQLVAHNYLSAMPTPASGPYGEVAKASDWWLLAPGMLPAVILQDKIDTATCRTLNSKLGVEGIMSQPDASRRIQCFGAASPYTLVLNPSGKAEVLGPAIDSWNRCVAAPTSPDCAAATTPEPVSFILPAGAKPLPAP